MGTSFKTVDLYGGAISVNAPSEFTDVSKIRQVPDHQEVYLSSTGFTSLIFDLGERVSHTATDEEALRYHFADIVDDKDSTQIRSIGHGSESGAVAIVPNLPPHTPVLTLLATTTSPSPPPPTLGPNQQNRPNTATSVSIMMTLIRLVPQNTDLVITLNIPKMPEEEERSDVDDDDDDDERGKQIMEEVRRTLQIRDWGLFIG